MALLPTVDQLIGAVNNGAMKQRFSDLRNFLSDSLGTDSSNKAAVRAALGFDELIGDSTSTLFFRNRARNPFMRLDQRSEGAATVMAAGRFPAMDAWSISSAVGSTFTYRQVVTDPGSLPYLAGCSSAMRITLNTSRSPGVSDTYLAMTGIEGYDAADLLWGTSAAKPIALQFFVNLSGQPAGNYSFNVCNAAGVRAYTFTQALGAGWNYVSKVIPGCTDGSWEKTTGAGILLRVDLGTGANYETSSTNAWLSVDAPRATGSARFVSGAAGSYIEITGLQIEAGSKFSKLERIDFDREMARAQRYCYKTYMQGVKPGTVTSIGAAFRSMDATQSFATLPVEFKRPMRVSPSCVLYNPATGAVGSLSVDGGAVAAYITGARSSADRAYIQVDSVSIGAMAFVSGHVLASAEF